MVTSNTQHNTIINTQDLPKPPLRDLRSELIPYLVWWRCNFMCCLIQPHAAVSKPQLSTVSILEGTLLLSSLSIKPHPSLGQLRGLGGDNE